MKWTYVIQQKLKIALLLGCIMLLIIVTNLLSRRSIENINKSFNSIYEDRLIPATELFYLSDNLHNKRLLMEKFLLNKEHGTAAIRNQLLSHSRQIDSLILKYEGTYLVKKEFSSLSNLKHQLNDYKKVEQSILILAGEGRKEEAQKLYESKGDAMILSSLGHLKELAQIQFEVGKDLLKDSESMIMNTDTLSTLQIIIAIVIGVIIQGFIFSSKVVSVAKEKFNLN